MAMAMPESPFKINTQDFISLPSPRVVKEGALWAFITRNQVWVNRYCYLIDDGTFLGYTHKRTYDLKNPTICFSVKKSQVFDVEEVQGANAINGFVIRRISWIAATERGYRAATPEERQSWIEAIDSVVKNVDSTTTSPNVKIATQSEATDEHRPLSEDPQPGPSRTPTKKSLDSFVIEKLLGKGSYGDVSLVREKETRKCFALKRLSKKLITTKDRLTNTLRENRIMQKIDHPFLVKLRYSFTTPEDVVLVMDFANGGDLFNHLYGPDFTKPVPFSEERAKFYAAELCVAIGYLHKKRIIHRDIKLENILLNFEGHILLADMGVSKDSMHRDTRTKTICGTPQYLAPEVVVENGYGLSVDWWCYGLVMFEMLTGQFPFDVYTDDSAITIYEKILFHIVTYPETLSLEAGSFLKALLIKDAKYRLGSGPEDYHEISRHAFFREIDWAKLKERELPPPFKPNVENEEDTRYFDNIVLPTSLPYGASPLGGEEPVDLSALDDFADFDYTFKERVSSSSDEDYVHIARTLFF